jgi:ATP-binding cassette, subfamily B, multidrug efflux pump
MSAAARETRQPAQRAGMGGPGNFGRVERAKNPRGTLSRLWPYFGQFKLVLAIVLVLVVAYSLLGLAGPYLLGVAIDRFIAQKQSAGLLNIVLLMALSYAATNLFQLAASWLMAGVSQRALQSIRRDLFAHVQRLPLRFFDRRPAGELMSRLTNDIDAINQAVSQNITSLLASVLSMAGILIAMFVLDVWLAIASVLVVPLMFWFTRFVATYTRRGFQKLQRDLGQLNGVMEETISGQKVVKAFRRNDLAVEQFRAANEAVYHSGIAANTYALMLMPLTGVLGNLFVIVLAGLGAYLALRGLVTVGQIATFVTYGQNFVSPLRQLSMLYNTVQAALAGAERVFEILDTPAEEDAPAVTPERLRGHVKLDRVTFGYVPNTPVIKQLSLEARAGDLFALVGPTGAGKTTIINLLTRFYEIDSGVITIDGRDIREMSKGDLRRQVGMVLQDTYLFSATVMENIRYGRLEASDAEVIEAARLADADHFIQLLPQGYATVLTERGGNLSQGQRQMLAIARAILADPAILILDEATSSVDTRTEARIQRALLRLMQGRTSFVIAHRLSTIRDASHVLVINNGEIVEQGTHAQLLDKQGFYHHLYVSQFKGQAI